MLAASLSCKAGEHDFELRPGLDRVLELVLARQEAPFERNGQQEGAVPLEVGAVALPDLDKAE